MNTSDNSFNYKHLNVLTLRECKDLKGWLLPRIDFLEEKEVIEIPVQHLNLSKRATTALLAAKLFTVKDINDFGLDQIHCFRNMGSKTLQEINDAFKVLFPESKAA